MPLAKVIKFITVMTALSLAYIHMQMQIIQLAYKGKEKEKQINYLVEENSSVIYTILNLKSAHNLGVTLLAENSGMGFVDPEDIVQVATPADFFNEGAIVEEIELAQEQRKSLLNFLPLGRLAQAREAE